MMTKKREKTRRGREFGASPLATFSQDEKWRKSIWRRVFKGKKFRLLLLPTENIVVDGTPGWARVDFYSHKQLRDAVEAGANLSKNNQWGRTRAMVRLHIRNMGLLY